MLVLRNNRIAIECRWHRLWRPGGCSSGACGGGGKGWADSSRSPRRGLLSLPQRSERPFFFFPSFGASTSMHNRAATPHQWIVSIQLACVVAISVLMDVHQFWLFFLFLVLFFLLSLAAAADRQPAAGRSSRPAHREWFRALSSVLLCSDPSSVSLETAMATTGNRGQRAADKRARSRWPLSARLGCSCAGRRPQAAETGLAGQWEATGLTWTHWTARLMLSL